MRKTNFERGLRLADLFRLGICVMLSFALAVGGMAFHPAPVQAAIAIDPAGPIADNLTECLPYTRTFSRSGTSCPGAGIIFFWNAGPPLPAWLTFDTSTGVISGCPDPGSAAGSPYGPFLIGVTELRLFPVCWAVAMPPCSVTLTVNPVDNITITPTYVAMWAMEAMPFYLPLSATGCSGNYTWSAAGLPLGLSVDPVSGVISGIPAIGSAGIYTVTVTATDLIACCCPPGSRDFILIIDSYAIYISGIITTSTYDFTVQIGPGLTGGQTGVDVDGSLVSTLGGNQSGTFTGHPGEIHFVTVEKTVTGSDPGTRFSVIGSNQKMVSESDPAAFFDYAREVYIETGSDPAAIAQPAGAGYYAIGDPFSSSAPSPVEPTGQQGTKYIFRDWSLPGGGTAPARDLLFNVSSAGMVRANYDTYYLLKLKSEYPVIDESSWELKDSAATWEFAPQDVPMQGFWGALGGTMRPENSQGTHVMTGPYTQVITWYYDFTVPIIVLCLIALLIIGLVVFIVLRSKRSAKPVVPAAPVAAQVQPPIVVSEPAPAKPAAPAATETKALSEAETKERANFCPGCGAPIDADATFCKKCGKKIA